MLGPIPAGKSDEGRVYRARFYVLIGFGVILTLFYLVTLGFALNLAFRQVRSEREMVDQWHRAQYQIAREHREQLLDHIQRIEASESRQEALGREMEGLMGRISKTLEGLRPR